MKIPVTIFTGFLGAGKTTLISSLIQQCSDERFVILVNEFGNVSIDGQTLSSVTMDNAVVIDVVGGLVGYTDDSVSETALVEAAEKHCPDRLIIETSGLAVPSAIAERLSRGELGTRFQLDSIITVIDTPWLINSDELGYRSGLSADGAMLDVFSQQIANADVVVLNKIDDLTGEQLQGAERFVRATSPTVRFLELAHHARLDASLVLGIHLHEPRHNVTSHADVGSGAATFDGHSHTGLAAHEHGLLTHTHLHEHDPGWMSFVLHTHQPQRQESVLQGIEAIVAGEPVLRAKGYVRDHANKVFSVQCVRDRAVVCDANDPLHNDEHGQLVFIGYNLDRQVVAEQLSRHTGTTWS